MAVGIEDVARRAGVSIATVSRALRGLPNVSDGTRDKVQRAADELGYSPNPNAARLASGRTTVLGIVVPSIDSWFFGKVASGAEAVFAEQDRDVTLFVVPPGPEVSAFVERRDLGKRVSGLLLVNLPMDASARRHLAQSGLPSVAVGAASGITPAVCIDEHDLARQAVQHLVDLGHRRIGLIGDVLGEEADYRVPTWRREVWGEVLSANDLDHGDDLFTSGGFTVTGGHRAALELLQRPNPPTAVFAMSDEMAFGVLWAARDLGLDVPGDLSVIGVDDHDVSEAVGLTTMRQDPRDQGERAARLLLQKVARPGAGVPVVSSGDELLTAALVERGTTRTLSAGHRQATQRPR